MSLIKYDVSFQVVSQSQPVESNCNSITFMNLGANTANVLGAPLVTNQSIEVNGNVGEICTTNFFVTFTGSGTKNLIVIRKIYAQ